MELGGSRLGRKGSPCFQAVIERNLLLQVVIEEARWPDAGTEATLRFLAGTKVASSAASNCVVRPKLRVVGSGSRIRKFQGTR